MSNGAGQTEKLTFTSKGQEYEVTVPTGLSDMQAYDWAMKNKPKFAALKLPRPKEAAPTKEPTFPGVGTEAQKISPQPKMFSKAWWKQRATNIEQAATEALPGLGASAGATAGGIAGVPAGPVGVFGGEVAGAGLGGMAGTGLKQILRRALGWEAPATGREAAAEMGREGMTQMGTQIPFSMMPAAAPMLKRSAESSYYKALAPTKERTKEIARDVVPGLIKRGEVGSIESLERRATERARELSPELTKEYGAFERTSPKLPARGAGGRMQATGVGQVAGAGTTIVKDLETLKGKYMAKDALGNRIVANQQAVDSISGVQDIVKKFGPNISPTSLRQLRQIFDEPVAKAGAYEGVDLATHYTLNAKEAAANSIRKIIHSGDINISELDKEVHFWLDVQRVTSETARRRVGQSGGLVNVFAPLAIGAAAETGVTAFGGSAAHGIEAGVGTAALILATRMIRSPQWRTLSAVTKDRIAGYLASGSVRELSALATRLGIAAERVGQEPEKKPQTVGAAP